MPSVVKFREDIAAGAYIQRTGTPVSSLTGITTASLSTLANITVNSITGAAGWRGIATINSGTTIASVAATAAVSGAVIDTTIYMYADVRTYNGSLYLNTAVMSVRAGAFEIVTVGSVAPISNMPVAWKIVR